MANKKAYLVDVSFRVRIVVDENVDPNIDPEFDQAVKAKLAQQLRDCSDNIEDWEEDEEMPYDPERDG